MPEELDIAVAHGLVSGAMGYLPLTPGNKVLWTKRQLQECMLRLAREACAMGFLSDQRERFGSSERQSWMDIRLDDPEELAKNNIRLRPVVVRSLIGAGYRCLGDLRWTSEYELSKLFYIGRITTREIRAIIRRFQTRRETPRSGA